MITMLLLFFISLAVLLIPTFFVVEPAVRSLQAQGRQLAQSQLAADREDAYLKVRAIRASPHLKPEDRDFLLRHGWIDTGKLALERKKESDAQAEAEAERVRNALEGQITSARKARVSSYGGYSSYNVGSPPYTVKDMRKRPLIIDEDQ